MLLATQSVVLFGGTLPEVAEALAVQHVWGLAVQARQVV